MKNIIKYSDLNVEIKDAIAKFAEENRGEYPDISLEDATLIWFESHFDLWMLDRYNKDRSSRRRHFRFDIEIPVKVVERLIDSDSPDAEELDYVGTIVNISRGGFYFRSAESFNPSSIIKVVIDLSLVDPTLSEVEALAMVVRNDNLGNKTHGIGVMFSSIYNGNRQNIDVFIFKNVAYHISSGNHDR